MKKSCDIDFASCPRPSLNCPKGIVVSVDWHDVSLERALRFCSQLTSPELPQIVSDLRMSLPNRYCCQFVFLFFCFSALCGNARCSWLPSPSLRFWQARRYYLAPGRRQFVHHWTSGLRALLLDHIHFYFLVFCAVKCAFSECVESNCNAAALHLSISIDGRL